MGEQNVILPRNQKDIQDFVKRLLQDTHAMEQMLHQELFETDNIRIGAEQEFNLVDQHFKPASLNLEVIDKLKNDLFTTELARFNMECNVEPLEFKGTCLSDMENQINTLLDQVRKVAHEFDTDIILTGILPTIRKSDVEIEHITPIPRYHALMEAILKLRGESAMTLSIKGIDELITKHKSPMVEASNTGFQVHLQVTPDDFAQKYNIAQAIAGPAMAAATNSPILFGKRLWKETRIALFQQSIDTRDMRDHLRDRSPRVMFGHDWVKKSILEIYREDIMRFRTLLTGTNLPNSVEELAKGRLPALKALIIHNSTVYRWNRPCFGVNDKAAHLRIENRVLPAGPTVADEMANAALWLGLLNGLGDVYPDITKVMDFSDAKANFVKVCRNGLDVTFAWVNKKKYPATELLKKELIPIAKEGLRKNNVAKADIDHYFDILEGRLKTGRTGAQWMLDSYGKLLKETTKDEALLALTASTIKNQSETNPKPVHTWNLASVESLAGTEFSTLTVENVMTTDVFTVQKLDILDLATEMMNNQGIRYIPVEDKAGNLVGLLTSRMLLAYYGKTHSRIKDETPLVQDIMLENPITIEPTAPITEALEIMQEKQIGSLPVVQNNELVGIIVEQAFLKITGRLIRRLSEGQELKVQDSLKKSVKSKRKVQKVIKKVEKAKVSKAAKSRKTTKKRKKS